MNRLENADAKVASWKGWQLSLREKVDLIKTYLIPIFLYVSFVCVLPVSLYTRFYSCFFQLLWGNRINLVKRNVTYLPRREGGLGMVNPVVFFSLMFVKYNLGDMLAERPPGWVGIFQSWFRPFLRDWENGGPVKSLRVKHEQLPAYVAPCLKMLRQWQVTAGEVKSLPRKLLEKRIMNSAFLQATGLEGLPKPGFGGGFAID